MSLMMSASGFPCIDGEFPSPVYFWEEERKQAESDRRIIGFLSCSALQLQLAFKLPVICHPLLFAYNFNWYSNCLPFTINLVFAALQLQLAYKLPVICNPQLLLACKCPRLQQYHVAHSTIPCLYTKHYDMHNIQHRVRHTVQHKIPCFRHAYVDFARESGFLCMTRGRVHIQSCMTIKKRQH